MGTISVVQAQFTYDATLLDFESAAVTVNWTGDFDSTVFIDEDSVGYVLLEFTAGSMSPPASATDLAELTFKREMPGRAFGQPT